VTAPAQTLTAACRAAAAYIDEHGWIQGEMETRSGVCLSGALKHCTPVPGDFGLVRAVHRSRDRAEEWNDDRGRTADDVRGYLATTEITDGDLEDTFGPQWRRIVAVVRTVAAATPEQLQQMADVDSDFSSRCGSALRALHDLTRAASTAKAEDRWDAARDAAVAAINYRDLDLHWEAIAAAEHAVRSITRALMLTDLIGQNDSAAEHLAILAHPYVSVFGEPEAVAS
jgi:hypothetical protein